jgi:hypothetical protein
MALAPAAALACPACNRAASPRTWMVIAALIAAPYLVSLAVVRVVRQAQKGGRP